MVKIRVQSPFSADIDVGGVVAKYNAKGTVILRYYVDLWQKELEAHKQLSAPEIYSLQLKVNELVAKWDKKVNELRTKNAIVAGKDAADQLTIEAEEKLNALSQILSHTLSVNDQVDWEQLKDHSNFSEDPNFAEQAPEKTFTSQPRYVAPRIGFFDFIFGRKSRKIAEAEDAFRKSVEEWETLSKKEKIAYERSVAKWKARKASFETAYAERKANFNQKQKEHNEKMDALSKSITTADPQSVIEHASIVLDKSEYYDLFEKSFEIDYLEAEKTLLIDYALPSPDIMPTLKAVRFVSSSGELKESHISEREKRANYDLVCYQICLRTIHEIIEADIYKNIENVLFNGFAKYIDQATGQDTTSCIMSVLVDRKTFEAIQLSRIEPKACFKNLKGISASTLSAMAPIAPVMEINKEDRRFIEAKTTHIDNATNLAAMDWGDFEHLVRELFEKEFASRGGEVKITQASSDGGVDAVAFDPDPITGGKIVIQAKRYTKTVGVSAVRDLFGTMQHEGASRGILITTADYGPDAYSFASGKPISLFTGANLLYLLDKHGYQAKIDLKAARKEHNLKER